MIRDLFNNKKLYVDPLSVRFLQPHQNYGESHVYSVTVGLDHTNTVVTASDGELQHAIDLLETETSKFDMFIDDGPAAPVSELEQFRIVSGGKDDDNE